MASHLTSQTLELPDLLDDFHWRTLDKAIGNILSTPLAEFAFAQLLDGLPTSEVLTDIMTLPEEDHPVFTLHHDTLCPGFIEKAREFRALFNLADLRFDQWPLLAFQDMSFGSKEFDLRLIELVVVACHRIGAYFYELDQGTHKHHDYDVWKERVWEEQVNGVGERLFAIANPIPFFHQHYQDFEQYPRGVADIAGYWTETQIFGGVIVFERGESEKECKAMWIHGGRDKGPTTLYPPTEEQFKALIRFLLSSPDRPVDCPLPIHGEQVNRPRWNHWHAFAFEHIFRDRYERRISEAPEDRQCVRSGIDWPELGDRRTLMFSQLGDEVNSDGKPYTTPEQVAAAEVNIRNTTWSSPLCPPHEYQARVRSLTRWRP